MSQNPAQYDVKIIADSQGKYSRITTMQLKYPRFIHSEFMTHRVFSRNASSSRAIPTAKLIEQVRNSPVQPVWWGKNQPGMQAAEELDDVGKELALKTWRAAARSASEFAEMLARVGAHKQIVNRVLEPFLTISVVVTSTEWDNFFKLRCHKDAQPEIRKLAEWMREALHRSLPKKLQPGQWHLPYVDAQIEDDEKQSYRNNIDAGIKGTTFLELGDALRASVARCARVSYLKHDGEEPVLEDDLKLFDRLMAGDPKHASPAEHQAMMNLVDETENWVLDKEFSANFAPEWVQFRQIVDRGLKADTVTDAIRRYTP